MQANIGKNPSEPAGDTTVRLPAASLPLGAQTMSRSKGRLAMATVQGRRAFLRWAAVSGGAGLLSSCSRNTGPAAAPQNAPRASGSPTAADWTALGHDLSG